MSHRFSAWASEGLQELFKDGNPFRVKPVQQSDKHQYECILIPVPSYRMKDGKRVPVTHRIVVEAVDRAAALEAINVIQAQYWPDITLHEKTVQLIQTAENPALPVNHSYSVRGGKARKGTRNA